MSVIVTIWFMADPEKVEEVMRDNGDKVKGISERAEAGGVIAHRFYGSEGQVMIIDEWPDEESFQRFFDGVQEEIGPMLAQAGVTSEPQVRFWHVMNTPDKIGWGA